MEKLKRVWQTFYEYITARKAHGKAKDLREVAGCLCGLRCKVFHTEGRTLTRMCSPKDWFFHHHMNWIRGLLPEKDF